MQNANITEKPLPTTEKKTNCTTECECKIGNWRVWSIIPLSFTAIGSVLLSFCAPSIWSEVSNVTGIVLAAGFMAGFFFDHTTSVTYYFLLALAREAKALRGATAF